MKQLCFSANTDAIDISLHTKETIVNNFIKDRGVELQEVACIGDSKNDLPFLTIPNIGIAAAPSNAQQKVIDTLNTQSNSYISKNKVYEGFIDFYNLCKNRNIKYIFSDRDGVILWKNEHSYHEEIYELFTQMGHNNNPYVFVLTGSSVEQNIEFINEYKINEACSKNELLSDKPFNIFAENGALMINCMTMDYVLDKNIIDLDFIGFLKKDYYTHVLQLIKKEVLNKFNLQFTSNANDQIEKIFIPEKRTMITFNIPAYYHNGSDYRESTDADELRKHIIEILVSAAIKFNINYKVL